MADFDIAFERVIKNEGGYSNHKKDKGGATMYGVSSKLLNSIGNESDIKARMDKNEDGYIDAKEIEYISLSDAKKIYKKLFWDANHYSDIYEQALAEQVFDFAVNAGSYRANILLQQSINGILELIEERKIAEDGISGPITIGEANSFSHCIVKIYKHKRKCFYKKLAQENPDMRVFLKGWLNRVDHV